ncbi:MAG: heme-copper oxidase subunit III [Candidatus Binatia bacterium]
MNAAQEIDAGALDTYGFGARGIVWWGVMAFIAIETVMLGLTAAAYGYLYLNAPEWPPGRLLPAWHWPTINLALLLASLVPMVWTARTARRFEERGVAIGLLICCALGAASCLIRPLEFRALNTAWDRNAYSSVVWTLLGLHTTHLVAEVVETIVITIWFLRGARAPRTWVDVGDNALYWYFIVGAWVPVYGLIVWFPRLVG